MKKNFISALMLAALSVPLGYAADYGLPEGIQEGNILHCFNWTAKEIKAELPNIAAAGFGSVQMSPLQRPDIKTGSSWHDLYRPYDLAFKASAYCSEQDLKDLCAEAETYGIKIIVDVVANHVDKTAGYHDTWWDSNGRVRWNGGINYGNRYSITHGQLGDYGDVNSEDAEVAARGKAYVEKLKSMGVKGIRWDAAKHIGLPSEGCNFWKEVTSVAGMYHYGEILDAPGPNASIIKEYTQYMSVTDNKYCNYAARENGGLPGGYGGDWAVNQSVAANKLVYWGESHDTYSNDEWSQNVDQSVIDRAWAAYACREGATALYLARPNVKGFNNIKVGKGSTAFKNKHIAEVNKFRNLMTGKADWFENSGNVVSVTRKDGGAVIIAKGSGQVSAKNGGGYCPAGTYTDRISGNKFTVTATTITGNVGSSVIAVIYGEGIEPGPTPGPTPTPTPAGDLWILGNLEGTAGWGKTPGTGVAMTADGSTFTAKGVKFVAAASETTCYFNLTDYVGDTWDDLNMNANRYGAATEGASIILGTPATIVKYANNVDASGCLSWTIAPGTYDITADLTAMTITVVNAGEDPGSTPGPTPTPGEFTIYYDNSTTNWATPHIHYWSKPTTTWPGAAMTKVDGDIWQYTFAEAPSGLDGFLFCDGKASGGDQTANCSSAPVNGHLYTGSGNKGAIADLGVYDTTPVDPNADVFVYLVGVDWPQPYVYIYNGDKYLEKWPGVAMEMVDGRWTYQLPDEYKNCMVIFSDNGNSQYPAANESGLPVRGRSMEFDYETRGWLTGLENVSSTAASYTVAAANGVITVAGAEGLSVIVAGIDGKVYRLASPAADVTDTAVAPGLYIVNVNGHSQKVLVK